MQCRECQSEHIRKNGINKQRKQNYICADCSRQFIDDYLAHQGDSDQIRRECISLYVNGMGFRAIERVKNVHHTTIISWVKQVGELLPQAYEPDVTPQVGELDELETYVRKKKIKFGCGQWA